MPDPITFTLTLRSPDIPTQAHVQVHIVDGPNGGDFDCCYVDDMDQWQCNLPLADYPDGIIFGFRKDGKGQLSGPIRLTTHQLRDQRSCIFDSRTVCFPAGDEILVDVSAVAKQFFPPDHDPTKEYDMVIVGSGAGGGTLAYELAATRRPDGQPTRVLLLEVGTYLFSTHTGNLPRHQPMGPMVDKNIWALWGTYGLRRWDPEDDTSAQAWITQGLNMAGRTLFWGALAPKMRWWEFRDWPPTVATEIRDVWYLRAQEMMRVNLLTSSPYQTAVKRRLRKINCLADYVHIDAPMAIEYLAPATGAVPAGIWSVAELLFGRRMQDGRFNNLQINLSTEVVDFVLQHNDPDPAVVIEVVAYDHVGRCDRSYRVADGGAVVLAAGTVGTASLAKRCQLADPEGLIGKGITDHPIYVVKFNVPAGNEWYSPFDSSKTLSRHGEATISGSAPEHPFNVVLELGANLNQFRFLSPGDFPPYGVDGIQDKTMPSELVFLVETPLVTENQLDQEPGRPVGAKPTTRPRIRIHPSPVGQQLQPELDRIADEVLAAFGGRADTRMWAPLGGVSHEVGTMRMGRPDKGPAGKGVVDENLRMSGYTNMYVCDLSIFPSAPAANPTLTLVALAMRLAAHLSR